MREFWSRAKVWLARCSVYNKVLETGKDDDRDRLRFLVIEQRNRKARFAGHCDAAPRPRRLQWARIRVSIWLLTGSVVLQ
jgi:hypothetical protein